MNMELSEREVALVLADRMWQEKYTKHKRVIGWLGWYSLVSIIVLGILAVAFKEQTRDWPMWKNMVVFLPGFVICFWPMAWFYVLEWRIHKQARAQAANAGK